MKNRLTMFAIFSLIPLFVLAQMVSTGYQITLDPPLRNGCSQSDIEHYLKSNQSSLNPIEGLYDVNWKQRTIYEDTSPYTREDSYPIGIVRGGKFFYVYAPYNKGFSVQSWLLIEPIGNTSLYNFMIIGDVFNNSGRVMGKERVLLQEGLIWEYIHSMTKEEVASQDCEKYGIIGTDRKLSAVKFFPSSTNVSGEFPEWTGTGFALKNGYIVTNFHVIDGANTIEIHGINGNYNLSYNASVIATDQNNDLALLKISDSSFSGFANIPYSVKTNIAEVGEDIYVLGYPLTSTMGNEIKLTTGIISAKTGFQGDVSLYQISAPIQPGNSGGPLFDNQGNVIGIVNAKHQGAENVGYAIKTSYLKNLIESTSSLSILPTANSVSSLPLTGKVRKEKNYVFMINCSSK